MPTCGYACINCGRCKGRMPKPILVPLCIECGHDNPFGSELCENCGASLELRPGITNTAGRKRERGEQGQPPFAGEVSDVPDERSSPFGKSS